MNGYGIFTRRFTWLVSRMVFSGFAPLFLTLMLAGCASFMQNLSGGEDAKKFQEANKSYEQGRYKEAYKEYRTLADSSTDSRLAEQSKFKAAYILVDRRNPHKDYALSSREFEEFLIRYPRSPLAGEAGSWLDILNQFESSRTNELLEQVDDLTKRADELTKELRQARSETDAVTKERDSLLMERSRLVKKVDDLLNDKDSLLKEKASFMREQEGLTKKIEMLNMDKDALMVAKQKLEKSLHDLTMVDVKTEKKRKTIKKDDK